MSERKDSTNIGGAWKKVSANGNAYISGKLNNGKYFVIFPNQKKEKETQPDYRILMDKEDATEMGLLYEPSNPNSEVDVSEIPF